MSLAYSVYLLIGQRVCSYPEEYAPEVIAAADEYAHDDNPEYLRTEHQKATDSKEYTAVTVLKVAIPFAEVEARLNINPPAIQGEITG